MIKKVLYLTLLYLIFASYSATAAEYYVRAGATGNGSNWTNAYGQIPAALNRGDTYYVADGTYNAFTVDDREVGAVYIFLKKATINDHGTNIGWNNNYGDGVATFEGTTYLRASYIDINGQYEYGFKFLQTNCNGDNDCISSDSAGTGRSFSYINLRYSELEQCGEDQGEYAQDCLYIRGDPSDNAHNWLISHCYLHDTNVTCILTRWVNNTIIENTTFARRHTNGSIHGELISWNEGGLNQNCVFRYNKMFDVAGTGMLVIKDATADQSGWKIYGNLFYNTTSSGRYLVSNATITDTGSPSVPKGDIYNIKVYNNTFVNIYGFSGNSRVFGSLMGASGNEFKNNLCYNTEGVSGVDEISHNLWNSASYANADQGNTGQYWSDGTVIFRDYSNHDYTITQATLPGDSSIGTEYSRDMFGNIRGADGTWDRGAFEYNGAGGGNQQPQASFSVTPESGESPVTCQFTDLSTDIDGSIVSWNWSFGDGVNSSEQNPVHTYTIPGNFNVSLAVTDNENVTNSFSSTITVSSSGPSNDRYVNYIKAEDGILSTPMIAGNLNNPVPYHDAYIYAPQGSGTTTNPMPEAVYSVNIPQNGEYYLWLRLFGPSNNNDAIYIGFNGNFDRVWCTQFNDYEWVRVETTNLSGNYSHGLSAGSNQINIGHAEESARIDHILVTDDPDYVPLLLSDLPFNPENITISF